MFFMETIKKTLINKWTGSLVRHALTAVGGFLVAKGVITPDQMIEFTDVNTPILIGSITFGIGQLLSFIQKMD